MLFPSVSRQRGWLIFLVLVLSGLNIYFHFTFESALQDRARYFDSLFGRALYPLEWMMSSSKEALETGGSNIRALWSAHDENIALKSRMTDIELELQGLREQSLENARLRELLGFRAAEKLAMQAAKVLNRDVSLYSRTLVIDRGTDDGLERGMPVIVPQGVVGRIIQTEDTSARVLLITDVNSRIDGLVQRSRTRVIVGGGATGDLTLRYLPRRHQLQQGDVIVSSGLGGFFPEGYKIGVVVGMAQDPHFVLEEVELEASVDFDSLESVFVVTSMRPKS